MTNLKYPNKEKAEGKCITSNYTSENSSLSAGSWGSSVSIEIRLQAIGLRSCSLNPCGGKRYSSDQFWGSSSFLCTDAGD
jgi:hypothetical protein